MTGVVDTSSGISARAMAVQQYFWYLRATDPEPSSYAMQLALAIDGPLDATRLQRAVAATIARHDVFRTALREDSGALVQIVDPAAPPFALALADCAGMPETVVDGAVAELQRELDLAAGIPIRGRLLRFAPERHVLAFAIDHGVCDGASLFLLQRELFRRYERDESAAPPPPQYHEHAIAFERFGQSPEGEARTAWWRAWLAGAQPLALPFDLPRAEVDARRAAAPHGIAAEPMHPMFVLDVPGDLREAMTRAAAATGASPSVLYLATHLMLLRELAGQDDICIENVYNPAVEQHGESAQGAMSSWTIMRFGLSAARTDRDVIATTRQAMHDAYEHSLIPDYFATVPRELRGVTFNYLPAALFNRKVTAGDVTASPLRRPFPSYKRHWHLMLFVVDSTRRGTVCMTGNQRLWQSGTIEQLARRYVAMLERYRELA